MSGGGKESVGSESERLEMASETAEQNEVRLAPRPQAAGEECAAVARFVADFSADAAFRAQLAVSEMVANCVRHVRFSDGERITVRLRRFGPTLRVEVEDPVRRCPRWESAAAGSGFDLRSRLADGRGRGRSLGRC